MSERQADAPLGISGRIARAFLTSQITPLLALLGLLMGVFALLVTPREEEPQIDVTFANVFIPFPGASVEEVEQLVSIPAQQVLSEIEGLEHVYSVSRPGMAVLSVQYEVGEKRTDALVRLYNQIQSNRDWFPPGLGVGEPIVKPKGIDDVPIVTFTLWTQDPERGGHELQRVAHALETELKRIPGTRDIYTLGGPDHVVRVTLDPQRVAGHGLALEDLRQALQAANHSRDAGALVRDNGEIPVQAGSFLTTPGEVADLVVGVHEGNPVHLGDVAEVHQGPDRPESYVRMGWGAAHPGAVPGHTEPAVTLAVAKQPGTNAVDIADQLIQRMEELRATHIPEGVEVSLTRNYGKTADDKATTLIQKLILATTSVVILVWLALGWREALIVGTAVVITLAITLFASWAYGFTLNRVSLFALIFSIGILVDDAIVVVENIHRHLHRGAQGLREAIPLAVDEVGGPTILATFTVIAALLPMAFVTGLMGPYMSPIPINASMGMVISLAVAYVVTPWMTYKLLRRQAESAPPAQGGKGAHDDEGAGRWMQAAAQRGLGPFLRGRGAGVRRLGLYGGMVLLILLAVSLVYVQAVVLKMLPFDNKSEFQVVVEMPEGTSLERTNRVLQAMGDHLATVPEVRDYQIYAGAASPINFNGLVRQYYLREGGHLGDIQVNLVDKKKRDRKSHDIALDVRGPLQDIADAHDAVVKVVEVPPGPPVRAPIVAEVYGPDQEGRIQVARQLEGMFRDTPGVVDVDTSLEHDGPRFILEVDREKAALLGVSQATVAGAVDTALGGEDVSYLFGGDNKYAVPIRLEFDDADKARLDAALGMRVRARDGGLVPLSEVVRVVETTRERAIEHKDLLPVVYVTADMAGRLDSPLYGMFDLVFRLDDEPMIQGRPLKQTFIAPPEGTAEYAVKWDGEWQITYETFRDMGLAYSVGLVLIYLLVVGQFRSYLVPLIIMAPIPLTLIGVMPGHALLGAEFTATSMIGMIALAGIIVRNSILLVDFINQEMARGVALEEAVIRAGAVRAKPILLTGLAAMIGAGFILDDPIFSGLAISLIFGILVSTLLTLVVIPVLYYSYLRRRVARA
ncbi:MAG: efflux RND transporter permease subunit [Ectothiorhodospira sp.]